nr:MAG TPA: hypothetical protein [Caudoviricetes sp.]
MQVITDFLCEAWRMLTESFAIKALLAVVAEGECNASNNRFSM